MTTLPPALLLYGLPLLLAWTYYAIRRYSAHRTALSFKAEAQAAGLDEPISLRPLIDPGKCIGCRACVYACPEGQVLGIVGSKAEVLAASNCIGHGSCKTSCPTGAIELVFGSHKRGVTLPVIAPNFETTVPGIFIAGELGGMGLIRNAIEQGRQAMDAIAASLRDSVRTPDEFDVVIVGAGPAGLSASLGAKAHGLSFVTLEQDTIGGTVAHYPRNKVVMTNPARLPLVGNFRFRKVGKDVLMKFWNDVLQKQRLSIETGMRVEGIHRTNSGYLVRTNRTAYPARRVLLAMGRRGSPRLLGVRGEYLPKVCYRLTDTAQYRGQRVLVVGGGDSALEAAVSLAAEPGTKVVLAYRGTSLLRPTQKNKAAIERLRQQQRIEVLLATTVLQIGEARVVLTNGGGTAEIENDAVIVCSGGVLPETLLQSIGIGTETKYGTA